MKKQILTALTAYLLASSVSAWTPTPIYKPKPTPLTPKGGFTNQFTSPKPVTCVTTFNSYGLAVTKCR